MHKFHALQIVPELERRTRILHARAQKFRRMYRNEELDRSIRSKYDVRAPLVFEGLAYVYEAISRKSKRHVALKVVDDLYGGLDEFFIHMFVRESLLIKQIEATKVVKGISFAQAGSNTLYFSMEFLNGRRLSYLSNVGARIPWRSARRIFIDICNGLNDIHEAGLVHRDIKPANIIIAGELDNPGEAKIIDLGSAKIIGYEFGEEDRYGMGTTGYEAPEQSRREMVDARSDIYSMAILMCTIVSGNPDIRGAGLEAREALFTLPNLPKAARSIILKAWESKPERRFQSAAEMKEAIETIR